MNPALPQRSPRENVEWLAGEELNRWDRFVDLHPYGLIYHLSGWLRTLESSFPHIRGKILVLRDADSGEILAGLPLYSIRSRILGNRVVSVPFSSVCDPLFGSKVQAGALIDAALSFCDEVAAERFEMRVWRAGKAIEDDRLAGTPVYRHHYLSLVPDTEQVLQRCSKTAVRQMIARARRNGFRIERLPFQSNIGTFCGMLTAARRSLGIPALPQRFFESIGENLGPSRASLWFAASEGKLVSGLLLLAHNDTAIIEYSADQPAFRGSGANQLLYWEVIRYACAEGYRILSLGRAESTNAGLIQYKRRWGTAEEDLHVFGWTRRNSGSMGNWENRLRNRTTAWVLRTMPEWLYRRAGEVIYRHWG